MWRGKASFPKFIHVISKWDCSMSSYKLFLLEYISWINLPTFTYISVHSLTNRHRKPDRMISHFVFILELRSSTTRGSGIDRSTLSHARERTVSSPGQTNSTCWALSLCAVSHSLHALLSKLHCMPCGWPPCNTARTPDTRFVKLGLCLGSCHQGCIPMWQTQFLYTSSSLYNIHDNFILLFHCPKRSFLWVVSTYKSLQNPLGANVLWGFHPFYRQWQLSACCWWGCPVFYAHARIKASWL